MSTLLVQYHPRREVISSVKSALLAKNVCEYYAWDYLTVSATAEDIQDQVFKNSSFAEYDNFIYLSCNSMYIIDPYDNIIERHSDGSWRSENNQTILQKGREYTEPKIMGKQWNVTENLTGGCIINIQDGLTNKLQKVNESLNIITPGAKHWMSAVIVDNQRKTFDDWVEEEKIWTYQSN